MESINYSSTVSIVQGPSITSKGELKADSYEKVSVTLPAKNYRILNILPTSNTEVVFLSIKASQYPQQGSSTLYYKIGSHEGSSSHQGKEASSKVGAHESVHHPSKVVMYNDHIYISRGVVQLLGKNLNIITFYNDGDEPVSMEILTCYNM